MAGIRTLGRDQLVDMMTKLITLTQDGRLNWHMILEFGYGAAFLEETLRKLRLGARRRTPLVTYETRFHDDRLRLVSYRAPSLDMSRQSDETDPPLELLLVGPGGGQFIFPDNPALPDLYRAVLKQTDEVDPWRFIENVLKEE